MRRILVGTLLLLAGVSCVPEGEAADALQPPAPTVSSIQRPSPVASGSLSQPAAEEFRGSVSAIDDATRAKMSSSWRAGCPVPLGDLKLLRLTHHGFDRRVHAGELVVHEDQARAVLGVFRALFDAGFPIERMELVDVYGGDDDRSMAANNTSGFNCRPSTGDADSWSQHAYGLAVDINPVQNPYVTKDGGVEPPRGARYADRSVVAAGLIHPGDEVVEAFVQIGWSWGGYWSSGKDYQHFSANGR